MTWDDLTDEQLDSMRYTLWMYVPERVVEQMLPWAQQFIREGKNYGGRR